MNGLMGLKQCGMNSEKQLRTFLEKENREQHNRCLANTYDMEHF